MHDNLRFYYDVARSRDAIVILLLEPCNTCEVTKHLIAILIYRGLFHSFPSEDPLFIYVKKSVFVRIVWKGLP